MISNLQKPHSGKFIVVCEHYFSIAYKGIKIPVRLGRPVDERDSGATALCFDCMDLADQNKPEGILAESVCTDCFQDTMNDPQMKKRIVN